MASQLVMRLGGLGKVPELGLMHRRPCRTAALAATRDQLLRLEAQRTEELQASIARYAELEEALALAEQSMEHVVDNDVVSSESGRSHVGA